MGETKRTLKVRLSEHRQAMKPKNDEESREEEGSISTSVHRKTTHTDQYLCFQSHHPASHKRAVVRTLMCRAEALSSSGVSRSQEEKNVTQALQRNGYLKSFIQKHTCSQPDRGSSCDHDVCASLTLPYFSGLSESIRRVLAPLAIQVSFRPFRTLRQELVHPKDPGQQTKGKEWCTVSLVPNVPAPTLAKQADPWMSAFGNTAGPEEWRPCSCGACVFM